MVVSWRFPAEFRSWSRTDDCLVDMRVLEGDAELPRFPGRDSCRCWTQGYCGDRRDEGGGAGTTLRTDCVILRNPECAIPGGTTRSRCDTEGEENDCRGSRAYAAAEDSPAVES